MPDDEQIIIDGALLGRVLRDNAVRWVIQGFIVLVVMVAAGLFLIKQTYTATCSVALQGGAAPSILGLVSGSGLGKRYIGVLKSRWAADKVASAIDLKGLYHLATQ